MVGCGKQVDVKDIQIEVLGNGVEVVEDNFVCGRDKVADKDGNEYTTGYFDIDGGHDVSKDGQCWMTENLNVGKVVLEPWEGPKRNNVIEKWCMTKDKRVEPKSECDWAMGHDQRKSDICDEEIKILRKRRVKSYTPNCDGTDKKDGYGGLYSWEDVWHREKQICPEGWIIARNSEWLKLAENIARGERKSDYGNLKIKEWGSEKDIGVELTQGLFNAKFVGYLDSGVFRERESAVRYWSWRPGSLRSRDACLITLTDEFEDNFMQGNEMFIGCVPWTFNEPEAYSVRCIKKEEN